MLKKLTSTIAICIASFAIASITTLAAEKDISVPLNKSYDACAFTITTENSGYYNIVVTSPKGTEYYGTIEGSDSTEILIKDATEGDWNVNVATVEESSSDAASSEDNEVSESENDSEAQADEEIGKVKVSVRAIDTSSYTIDDDVKVAKDIVGLKMYFKDDNLEVEWSDSSVGNVVVTVTDTQTNVEIGKETVKGNSFECAIPTSTKQITVSVVPATSTNVEGAANQYTLDFVNEPDATVTYENKEYVNTETIPVTVELNDEYGVEFVVNGNIIEDVPLKEAGTYEYEIPISEGSNEVLTYIVDADGNMRSTAYSVTRDTVSPNLQLERNYDGAQTYNEMVTFSGSVSDYSEFTINDSEVKVSGDGVFSFEYELHDGENSVIFRAVDLAGNETVYNATVIKLIEEETEIPWIPIISGVIILIGIIIFIIRKRNDPGNGDYNNLIDGIKEKLTKSPKKEVRVEKKNVKKDNSFSKKRTVIELVIVAAVSFGIFKYVIIPGYVPSESMYPTLNVGDWGFANGLAYVLHEPQRGDIIVFESEELNETLIKRVIGLPGDTVSFYDGYVYINDGLIVEEYIDSDVETNSNVQEFIVPEGCYFVLGDNRESSYDSRFWSNPYVSADSIKGKYMFTILHLGSGSEK